MKKLIGLFVMLVFLTGCDNCRYETFSVEIGQISFDGMPVTFYEERVYRGDQLTSEWLYYTTSFSDAQNDGMIESQDGSLKMFVDFYGEQEVQDELRNVVEPNEYIQHDDHHIYIYFLDADKRFDVLDKGQGDYSFMTTIEPCTESKCTAFLNLEIKDVEKEIEGWTELGNSQDYVRPDDFTVFFEITKNRRKVGELRRVWTFAKSELEDGRWIVFLMEDERVYYLLSQNQAEAFLRLIEL